MLGTMAPERPDGPESDGSADDRPKPGTVVLIVPDVKPGQRVDFPPWPAVILAFDSNNPKISSGQYKELQRTNPESDNAFPVWYFNDNSRVGWAYKDEIFLLTEEEMVDEKLMTHKQGKFSDKTMAQRKQALEAARVALFDNVEPNMAGSVRSSPEPDVERSSSRRTRNSAAAEDSGRALLANSNGVKPAPRSKHLASHQLPAPSSPVPDEIIEQQLLDAGDTVVIEPLTMRGGPRIRSLVAPTSVPKRVQEISAEDPTTSTRRSRRSASLAPAEAENAKDNAAEEEEEEVLLEFRGKKIGLVPISQLASRLSVTPVEPTTRSRKSKPPALETQEPRSPTDRLGSPAPVPTMRATRSMGPLNYSPLESDRRKRSRARSVSDDTPDPEQDSNSESEPGPELELPVVPPPAKKRRVKSERVTNTGSGSAPATMRPRFNSLSQTHPEIAAMVVRHLKPDHPLAKECLRFAANKNQLWQDPDYLTFACCKKVVVHCPKRANHMWTVVLKGSHYTKPNAFQCRTCLHADPIKQSSQFAERWSDESEEEEAAADDEGDFNMDDEDSERDGDEPEEPQDREEEEDGDISDDVGNSLTEGAEESDDEESSLPATQSDAREPVQMTGEYSNKRNTSRLLAPLSISHPELAALVIRDLDPESATAKSCRSRNAGRLYQDPTLPRRPRCAIAFQCSGVPSHSFVKTVETAVRNYTTHGHVCVGCKRRLPGGFVEGSRLGGRSKRYSALETTSMIGDENDRKTPSPKRPRIGTSGTVESSIPADFASRLAVLETTVGEQRTELVAQKAYYESKLAQQSNTIAALVKKVNDLTTTTDSLQRIQKDTDERHQYDRAQAQGFYSAMHEYLATAKQVRESLESHVTRAEVAARVAEERDAGSVSPIADALAALYRRPETQSTGSTRPTGTSGSSGTISSSVAREMSSGIEETDGAGSSESGAIAPASAKGKERAI